MQTKSPWLALRRPNSYARLRLFCFPYAGGSETAYRTWQENMPQVIKVLPVQLPGRGIRMKEPPYTRIAPLVEALGPALIPEMDLPFAFFGHSMGGLIAFELAHWLRKEQRPLPVHLFVSAKSCPLQNEELPRVDVSDAELVNILKNYEGTPSEVLGNAELMQLLLGVIRADMELCQTYIYGQRPPLECPISAFGGLKDHARPRATLESWKNYTTGRFKLHMFPAGHFFIQTWERSLVEVITKELAACVLADRPG